MHALVPLVAGAEAAEGLIRKLWCALVDGDLLLFHESDYFGPQGDFVAGGILRVTPRGAVRWAARSEGNVGPPLVSRAFAYVTGIGFVGKLDLRSGRYAWRHGDLYRTPGLYNGFALPHRDRGGIVFPAVHHNLGKAIPGRWPKALVVDDAGGAIWSGVP